MRVLMTGSHGFVGTNLIEALSDQHEIVRWDASKDQPLPEVDAVIHLAGLAHDTRHTNVAEAYYRVNTLLTQQIYNRFLESSANKFIFFSSIKAKDGDTPYALSKKKAEDYILSHMKLSSRPTWRDPSATLGMTDNAGDDDKNVYILRPCMIHGKRNKGNLNLLFKVVNKGYPWPLAAFENKRSFASMGNVAFVVRELLERDVPSGIYNLCDDEAISTNELIKIICDCLGKKVRFYQIHQGVMETFAKLGDMLHLPLNTERLKKLTENYVVDNTKIKQTLGIIEMPVRAVDGLRTTINYMKEIRRI